MDALVMELSDMVYALRREIKRLRDAAKHVINTSSFNNSEELAELGKAIRKLQIELDHFAPSMGPSLALKGKKSR